MVKRMGAKQDYRGGKGENDFTETNKKRQRDVVVGTLRTVADSGLSTRDDDL